VTAAGRCARRSRELTMPSVAKGSPEPERGGERFVAKGVARVLDELASPFVANHSSVVGAGGPLLRRQRSGPGPGRARDSFRGIAIVSAGDARPLVRRRSARRLQTGRRSGAIVRPRSPSAGPLRGTDVPLSVPVVPGASSVSRRSSTACPLVARRAITRLEQAVRKSLDGGSSAQLGGRFLVGGAGSWGPTRMSWRAKRVGRPTSVAAAGGRLMAEFERLFCRLAAR
jgi:hypothetical protein